MTSLEAFEFGEIWTVQELNYETEIGTAEKQRNLIDELKSWNSCGFGYCQRE